MPLWFQLVSMILNLLLSGGLIVTLATLRSVKREANASAKKAEAQAKASEIENVEAAVKFGESWQKRWRGGRRSCRGRWIILAQKLSGLNATNRCQNCSTSYNREYGRNGQQTRMRYKRAAIILMIVTCNSMPSATGDGDTAVC